MDKQPIVALKPHKSVKRSVKRSNIMMHLKKEDLELIFYDSMDLDQMKDILARILP